MITEYKIAPHRFDVNLLPPQARQIGTAAFKTAVLLHFASEYAPQGLTAMVTVNGAEITVMAFSAGATARQFVLPMLHTGRIAEAISFLESLTHSAPANAEVLYNLGIAYSELGQFDEAIIRLKRAVQLSPGHAQLRKAIALEIAVLGRSGLDINNPTPTYTLKSLRGNFTGLHLLAMMFTALRQMDPALDAGVDFTVEFDAALKMQTK